MKWIQTLLISVLLLGQVHLCRSDWQLPDGQSCAVCPTLLDDPAHSNASFQTPEQDKDCHDCCEIAQCDSHSSTPGVSPSVLPHFAPAILTIAVLVLVLPEPEESSVAVYSESCPATGPPPSTPARAPPVFSLA
ncbi:MAG: hypothetical protein K8R88_00635 [Armatimonadetes bacterium]|nr:hypothetical protein [Armatimonadota bacterium]